MLDESIVVAIGGNALAPVGESSTIADQFRHTRESLGAIVDLAAQGWKIAIVHGNGPQVGDALAQQEAARSTVPPLPLGVLVAGTQGWIGYMVQQSLQNALAHAGVARQVVTVVTQVEVDPSDPALRNPAKPVGRVLDRDTAEELAATLGWQVAPVQGGWRRVVASPVPTAIVECDMVRSLVGEGHLVIVAGGGGVPVYRDRSGAWEGLDGVVDKDRAAAILARDIGADVLVVLTDADCVYVGYGTPDARPVKEMSAAEADRLLASGQLGAGSMAPKVEAATRFIRNGGRRAVIARLDQGREAVAGSAGTQIVP